MKHSLWDIAIDLDKAAYFAKAIEQISKNQRINLFDSYEIQMISVGQRLERGEKLTGYKMGFTSKAKKEQMGVDEVIWGRLTDSMQIENGGILDFSKFIHPRAEPEIAYKISKTIDKVLTHDNVTEYFDAVAGAIEIIDSRYENFKFSLEDVIADNCSSSAYVIGDWHAADTPVSDLGISLIINNKVVKEGNSKAILGNPVESLIEMSKMAYKYDVTIEKGYIVLAGAVTSAEFINKGDTVQAVIDTLSTVQLNVK
ncbi:MAG: fumarylacetoacetate hydrolase family protein [Saprospiraceae bacterium]